MEESLANLEYPQNTIAIIQKYQFAFQKKFGQNFLIDAHVLNKIIGAASISEEDCVLEIGPGIGTLTQHLAQKARQVIAVEIDKNLIPILKETLADYPNITLLHADILKLNIQDLVDQYNAGKPIKVVANLPYYITTPIIMELFESQIPLDRITVMVQKEVADRMQATPGSKDYGALSLAIQYYANPYIAAHVPPNCFMPRPNVSSSVICLTKHNCPPVEVKDVRLLFRLIRASFNQRRKTLVNGLYNSSELSFSKDTITHALQQAGLPSTVRGETLTLEQFANLSNILIQND